MSRARDLANLGSSADAGGLTGRNIVINGAMQVAQRGTSSTSAGINTVDRWNAAFGGSGAAVTQSQESLASSDAPYALGLRNYFRSTVTGTSTDTAAYHQILQYVEAQNMAQSGWNLTSTNSFITLSFWVRSSLAGTYTVYLRSMDGTSQAYAHEFTLSANTWTKVTKTIPGASNITINNDNGQGLLVDILPHYGTDYTTSSSTTNAWKAFDGADVTNDYAQNWLNTSGATFDVTGVQLEVGSTATPFELESFGTTLAKCQRYYSNVASFSRDNFGQLYSSTQGKVGLKFPVIMRTAATVTANSPFTSMLEENGVAVRTPSAAAVNYNSKSGCIMSFTLTGTAGNGLFVRQCPSDTTIEADAEL